MEEVVTHVVEQVVVVVEALSAVVIAVGVARAFVAWAATQVGLRQYGYEQTRLYLGRFLALGLEIQLGADILATAISPSWDEIGKLGAIAGIRTLLNYFLAQDIDRAAARTGEQRHAAETGGMTPLRL
jgi:uncharacterized membrane protein